MKVLLTILCGTVILFVGGCVMSFGSGGGPIVWASWGIAGVNLLMIAAMWGIAGPMRPLFVAMAVIDVALALGLGFVVMTDAGTGAELMAWGFGIVGAFLVKGALSYWVAKRVKRDAVLGAVDAPGKDTPPDV